MKDETVQSEENGGRRKKTPNQPTYLTNCHLKINYE